MYQYPDYLMHYGVKGMKWGVRRAARKDAKEYARAKMYYGEGAGTRRKLIKARVEQRSKDSADYKKEFDSALAKQDMAKHATKAKRERVRNTAVSKARKTARSIFNVATGNIGHASTGIAAAYMIGQYTGVNQKIAGYAKQAAKTVYDEFKGRREIAEFFRRNGLRF